MAKTIVIAILLMALGYIIGEAGKKRKAQGKTGMLTLKDIFGKKNK